MCYWGAQITAQSFWKWRGFYYYHLRFNNDIYYFLNDMLFYDFISWHNIIRYVINWFPVAVGQL